MKNFKIAKPELLNRQNQNHKKNESNGTRIKSDLNGFTRINPEQETSLNIRENPPDPRYPRSYMIDLLQSVLPPSLVNQIRDCRIPDNFLPPFPFIPFIGHLAGGVQGKTPQGYRLPLR